MDIEIQTQTKNPLLNRTEVHFIVQHIGEQTPKRELIRSELAEKLKVKKDQIIVDNMQSHFGLSRTKGYAKVYKSIKEAQSYERDHLLKRNNAFAGGKTKEEKSKEETTEIPSAKEPSEKQPPKKQEPAETNQPEKPEEKPKEQPPTEEKKE
jgi:small subunit ribosomal protein S24e